MDLEEENTCENANEETHHHEETPIAQKALARNVQSLVAVIEELGNTFVPDRSSICQYPPKISAINVNKQSRAGLLLAHPVSYILKIQKTYGTFRKAPSQNQQKSVRL